MNRGEDRRRGGGIDAPPVFGNIFLDNLPQGSLSTSLHVTVTLTTVCRQGEELSNHPSVGTVIKLQPIRQLRQSVIPFSSYKPISSVYIPEKTESNGLLYDV